MSKPSTGPPQALISRIDYLPRLLKRLPESLPLDPPESPYQFYLDEDRVADAGTVYPVIGRAFELSFGTWKSRDAVVRIEERGSRVVALAPFLKSAIKRMSARERETFTEAWIDRWSRQQRTAGHLFPRRPEDANLI
ncbi:hypothetical protein B0H13DRAFT_1873557 [Mycena leptocephala]|nr:hypothetical protein B0H13DRAFT_1873557 [Mycena leptocephala]